MSSFVDYLQTAGTLLGIYNAVDSISTRDELTDLQRELMLAQLAEIKGTGSTVEDRDREFRTSLAKSWEFNKSKEDELRREYESRNEYNALGYSPRITVGDTTQVATIPLSF